MPDYKQDIAQVQERVEGLLAAFEQRKEDFSKAYEIANFEKTIEVSASLKAYLDQIISIFYLHHRKTNFKRKTDFRSDQRLTKLVVRLRNILNQIEEDISSLNLGEFVRHIDQANLQVYKLLERCDDISLAGVNHTHPLKTQTKTTSVIREDFANWESWANQERQKDDDHFDEIESPNSGHLIEIFNILGKTGK